MVNKRAVMVHAGDGGLAWALWNDGMDVMKNERLELEQPKCCVNTVE